MGHLLYLVKRHYFYVNLAAASVAAVSGTAVVNTMARNSLEAGGKSSMLLDAPRDEKKPRALKRAMLTDYDGLLKGNLLRDLDAPVAAEEGGVNMTDLTLVGTVSGPWDVQMATFQVKGEQGTREYSAGAKIGSYRLTWVGREFVWVKTENGEKIKISLESEAQPQAEASSSKKPTENAQAGGRIKSVISRDKLNRALKNQGKLMRGIAMGPHMKGDKIAGYKLKRIRKGHFFYELGARSGDIITRVNGQDFGKMDKMLQIWGDVKNADKVVIDLERNNVPTTFEVHIK